MTSWPVLPCKIACFSKASQHVDPKVSSQQGTELIASPQHPHDDSVPSTSTVAAAPVSQSHPCYYTYTVTMYFRSAALALLVLAAPATAFVGNTAFARSSVSLRESEDVAAAEPVDPIVSAIRREVCST